jgi:hypothetical protein
VRTKKWWLHVVADELHTYLFASHTRARSAPEEAGVLGDFSGVTWCTTGSRCTSLHDRATPAICLAHMLRDLASVGARWN